MERAATINRINQQVHALRPAITLADTRLTLAQDLAQYLSPALYAHLAPFFDIYATVWPPDPKRPDAERYIETAYATFTALGRTWALEALYLEREANGYYRSRAGELILTTPDLTVPAYLNQASQQGLEHMLTSCFAYAAANQDTRQLMAPTSPNPDDEDEVPY